MLLTITYTTPPATDLDFPLPLDDGTMPEVAFQRAVEVYQEFKLPWDEARGCYEWATAQMGEEYQGTVTGHPQALLKRALSLWEPMGASLYAEQCRARLG